MKVSVRENSKLTRELVINFRVFDDGFGFRYEFQKNLKEFIIMDELTEFNLLMTTKPGRFLIIQHSMKVCTNRIRSRNSIQLQHLWTMETKNGLFLIVHQANLTDYASMNLAGDKKSTKLKAYLTPWATGEKVFAKAPSTTPWRTVIIAKSTGDLMLSRLMLNLNEPNKLGDVSWIKPGRYIGIWWAIHMEKYTWKAGPNHGAKTENVLRYIDFAAKHNFSGVLVEGWNKGWEDWKDFQFS
jgi:alpha-glucosidase